MTKIAGRTLRHIISIPFIWWPLVPVILLDISFEIYHRVAFKLYRLPYVKRSEYIRIDRHKLSYLDWVEKLNCLYCGYVNGFLYYASTIAGVTEDYWCAIRHEEVKKFHLQPHQAEFAPYGDEAAYQSRPSGFKRAD